MRHLTTRCTATVNELVCIATGLFFPDGKSSKGKLENFDFEMMDFMNRILDSDVTVQELYDSLKVKMLRIYLATKIKSDAAERVSCSSEEETADDEQLLPRLKIRMRQRKISEKDSSKYVTDDETRLIAANPENTKESKLQSQMINETFTFSVADEFISETPLDNCLLETYGATVNVETGVEVIPIQESIELSTDPNMLSDDSGTIQFGPVYGDSNSLEDTLPLDSAPTAANIKLHRGHVFAELNDAMLKGEINENLHLLEVSMKLPNGKTEEGEDSGGVLRDALSEYWETFHKKCTRGNLVRIPVIRHDMTPYWKEIAKVLVLGYKLTGYFPIYLCQPFLEVCLSSEGAHIELNELKNAFLKTIPDHEKVLIDNISDDVFIQEEFLDFLESHDVKTIVTPDNWDKVYGEIAHKEVIQEPAYIAEMWRPVFQNSFLPCLPAGGLNEIFSKLEPQTRKVLSSLDFGPDVLPSRNQYCAELLKKYIRQLSKENLKRFLRFCTGSNLQVCNKIYVRFITPLSSFARNPVAHTCGCVLEVPNTYSSLIEMTEEFNLVLESNVWVMDIH